MTHPFRILDPSTRSSEFAGRCALAVMAKAPRPGKVKTRLSPPLTPEQASALNACFLRDTVKSLRSATASAPAEWIISYTPVGEEAAFRGILPDGALLLPQRGEDFGERLFFTAEDLFACGFSALCLIDSDSPTVPTEEFISATTQLLKAGARAILGPSEDGGYYLIGMQTPIARLFEDIAWSTSAVTVQTIERASEIGLEMSLLSEWYDVDDARSLNRLYHELFHTNSDLPRGYEASHTSEYLAQLQSLKQAELSKVGSTV
jgi:rSAM/selenodomain-associated transferase 1